MRQSVLSMAWQTLPVDFESVNTEIDNWLGVSRLSGLTLSPSRRLTDD